MNDTDGMTTAVTIALPSRQSAQQQLTRVREFQATVRDLFVKDHDFGVIPGTQKPTLLKPGAEKLAKLLGLADTYDFLEKSEDWDRGFFNYTVRCRLLSMESGQIVAEGLGNCNSWEAKYRWRWVWPRELTEAEKVGLKTRQVRNGGTQYRVENDDIYSQINTVIKMAKKRALVDAALSAGRLSDVFTQDLDDVIEGEAREVPARPAADPHGIDAKLDAMDAERAERAARGEPEPDATFWKRTAEPTSVEAPPRPEPEPAPTPETPAEKPRRAVRGSVPTGDSQPTEAPVAPQSVAASAESLERLKVLVGRMATFIGVDSKDIVADVYTELKVPEGTKLTEDQAQHVIAWIAKKLPAEEPANA